MFNSVNQKQNFSKLETEELKFWEKNKIFDKSVSQRETNKKYVFFDGPPFANGLPHYGHILANVLKDAVVRYFAMKGYYVPRVNGWDCHGLPVEYEIEKELKISGRKQIQDYGIEKFNDSCRESVFRYTDEWEKTLKRIGRWVDFEHSYATLNTPYMESIWWVFKQIWDKGMVYQGYKSMHICPRCETPLSNFEVTQGYKDVTDLSITIKFFLENEGRLKLIKKFNLKADAKIAVLAWTTTPWTLPGNTALAVGPKIEYALVNAEGANEFYIVAKNLVDRIFAQQKFAIIGDLRATDLEEMRYIPLFDFYKNKAGATGYKIVLADFVATEEGTGVVHCAPAFGEDDYAISQKKNLPVIQHVGIDGNFAKETGKYAGKFAKALDLTLTDDLAASGQVFKKENVRHSYPHCWRCDTPLLNYSTKSWFIRVTDVKKDLIKNNKKIHWQPSHIGPGRFGKWLEEARDWAISRNRYWGCPIPIWECSCGNKVCIGSIEELKKMSGGRVPMRKGEVNLHIPYIDEIKFKCSKCGGGMKRISEVLDCWFESGAMPYAQLHYPFENKNDFENNFPAHFIAEGLDQTRGWFYTLHILSTILFSSPAFKNVIVNGILLAEDGEKLSKRKKNYPDPHVIFETKGVDALRFFLLSSNATLAEDVRFSERHIDEILKQFLLPLWNTYSFFVMYANIDKYRPGTQHKAYSKNLLDKWILSELNSLIVEVTENFDDYNLMKASRPMIAFVDNLSNWYVRRSRRRFWKSENDTDKFEAYETLYAVLVTLSKIIAPITPFIADEIYKNLTRDLKNGRESVHLEDWPKPNKKLIDSALNEEMRIVRLIVNLGLSCRSRGNIKVRQPLHKLQIALPNSVKTSKISSYKDIILEELNVKNIEFIKEIGENIKQVITVNPRVIGPKYGADTQKIINACKEGKFELASDGKLRAAGYELESTEFGIGYVGTAGMNVESANGITVLLDSHIDKDLLFEGYAREIVRAIQEMRKKAAYNVSDRIYIFVESADKELSDAITKFADYIKRETLAIELQDKGNFEWDVEESPNINEKAVKIGVRKQFL